MARLIVPEPVKLIVAALWADADTLKRAKADMVEVWGELDHEGTDCPFDVTDYYDREMGPGLRRRLLSFVDLVPPEFLVTAKHDATDIENRYCGPHGRLVNLDVGYLDHHKLVLGSAKPAGQKIYLGQGVYADSMCRYAQGHLEWFEWAFPDFRDGRYEKELLAIRSRYLLQVRGWKEKMTMNTDQAAEPELS